jgi:NADH:ubiquinone oxidoreductase subunit 5 (subunit L)/multisubunit Na+/H+ antiporter MnhA subunit
VPAASLPAPVCLTGTTIVFVTPWRVNDPVTSYSSSPVFLNFVPWNVAVGNSFTLKKSGPRRCSSRFALSVFTLATLTVTVFESAEHLPKVYEHGHGHGMEWLLMLSSIAMATGGLGLSSWLYRGRQNPLPARLLERFPRIHRVIFNKYYVDEIYQATAVRGFLGLSHLLNGLDKHIIDGVVNGVGTLTRAVAWVDGFIDARLVDGAVNAVADIVHWTASRLRGIQTGRLPSYLSGLAAGTLLLLAVARLLVDLYR